MIEVVNLSKNFKVHKKQAGLMGSVKSLFSREWITKEALKSVSLKVQEGEILGLIGANGAGKTTLVKILSGIIYPTSGKVSVLGFDPWQRQDEFRRQISLIMGQKAQLWWDLPAADGFLLLKEIYQISDVDYKRRLDELVTMLDVGDQLNIQVRRLSLGERMKMELIAALLHQPRVVFLDEPTIGLDLTAQKAVRSFLLKYQKEHKPIMILTSHYMEDFESLCQRIAIIKEGGIYYDGPLANVLQQFTQSKLLHLNLKEAAAESEITKRMPKGVSLSHINDQNVYLNVPKAQISETINVFFREMNVSDLNVQEPDIGEIIESIIRKKGSVTL
jgi:ABC-2 type transport system ATP-binding protein